MQPECVGGRWIAGWLRSYQHEQRVKELRWAERARGTYHVGVLALLAGITALAAPADGAPSWHWSFAVIAGVGTLIALLWIAVAYDLHEPAT